MVRSFSTAMSAANLARSSRRDGDRSTRRDHRAADDHAEASAGDPEAQGASPSCDEAHTHAGAGPLDGQGAGAAGPRRAHAADAQPGPPAADHGAPGDDQAWARDTSTRHPALVDA